MELKGVFRHPYKGIVQNMTIPLRLQVQPGTPNEQITIKSLSLHLETILAVPYRDSHTCNMVKSDPLIQAQLIRSGNVIDMSDLLSNNKVPSTLAPSFDTSLLKIRHQIQIKILLSCKSSLYMMLFSLRIPLVVLSPYLEPLGNSPETGYKNNDKST